MNAASFFSDFDLFLQDLDILEIIMVQWLMIIRLWQCRYNGGSCKHENSNLSNFMSFPPQSAEADSVQLWTVKEVFMKKLNVIFLRFPDLPSADLTLISESSSNTN